MTPSWEQVLVRWLGRGGGGGISCIGSELSEKQVKFAEDRLKKTVIPKKWFDWE